MSGISAAVLDELAAVVGVQHVSADDCVTASHDWYGLGADVVTSRTLLGKPPGAVVLPGSTEEVASIVKVCNRHKLKFKAHSTGYGNYAGVGTKGSVSIDLRRMNNLEINAESRMAIIEPYATAGELMAEANKRQLMCHIIGAGPMHSPLASATSFAGVGVPGNHTGNNSRNLLSLEWVTPEGEIVRIGSSGSDAGWFTGEGPGPGFRGMIRGVMGAAGGLGVFTKIGIKLYPWAGPPTLEWFGEHPQRGIHPPENFATYQLSWDNWQDAADATHHFQVSRTVTFITRTPPAALGNMLTTTNREYYDLQRSGQLPDLATAKTGVGWTVTLMAWSPEEFAWKNQVVDDILARTGGKKIPLDAYQEGILTANMFTSLYVTRFSRMGDGAGVSLGILDSSALIPDVVRRSEEDIGEETKPGGGLMEVDTEQNWMWLSEGRHFWTENNPSSTRFIKNSRIAVLRFILGSFIRNEKKPLGFSFFIGGAFADLFGPELGHPQKWMRRAKNTWDPENLSDSSSFIQPKPGPEVRAWPWAKKILFYRRFKPLLNKVLAGMVK